MHRRLFTTREALANGLSHEALRWAVRQQTMVRAMHGVYAEGSEPLTPLDEAIAVVLACGGVATGTLAAMLHRFDGFDEARLKPPFVTVPYSNHTELAVRRRDLPLDRLAVVNGIACTSALQTLLDLAAVVDDVAWEQALESALRQRVVAIDEIAEALISLGKRRTCGVSLMRRVLQTRPVDAPPTESLLETLMVQLIRTHTRLPSGLRQVEVLSASGQFVARVDFAWPNIGLFLDLDGQHHLDQPVYDARRETAIVAATGWLPGRFTWAEVVRTPKTTARRVSDLYQQAERLRATG